MKAKKVRAIIRKKPAICALFGMKESPLEKASIVMSTPFRPREGSQAPVTTIVRPVIVQMMIVSMKVPVMQMRPWRTGSLVFAAAAAAVYLKSGAPLVLRITYAAEILFIAAAAYFNFKHLCAEDIECGIIKSLRGYNFFALLLAILYTAEIVLDAFEFIMLKSVVYLLMSACMLMIIPALDNGMTKWKVRPAKSRRKAENGQ